MNYTEKRLSIQDACGFYDVPMSILSDYNKKDLADAGYDLYDLSDDDCVNVNYIDAIEILDKWQLANSDYDCDWDGFDEDLKEILGDHAYYYCFTIDNDTGKYSDVQLVDNAADVLKKDYDTEDWLMFTNGDYTVFDEERYTDGGNIIHSTIGVIAINDYDSIPDENTAFNDFIFSTIAQSFGKDDDIFKE